MMMMMIRQCSERIELVSEKSRLSYLVYIVLSGGLVIAQNNNSTLKIEPGTWPFSASFFRGGTSTVANFAN